MTKSLWEEIISTIKPLKSKTKGNLVIPNKIPRKKENTIEITFISTEDVKRKPERHIIENDLSISDTSRIDKTIAKKIKKDLKKPDSTLDLHGHTLQSAYETFIKFVSQNYTSHNRTLLVITGHGNPEKQTGTIRKEFPKWINAMDIRQMILYVEYAPYQNKNDGAFYIYLRK